MAPSEFNRTEEFVALDWRDACVTDRGFGKGWSGQQRAAEGSGTWTYDVREQVVRRTRRHALQTADEALAEWTAEQSEETRREFETFATIWRQETAGAPFVVTRVTHWAYQRIIGMGPKVVALILEDLEREPDHWYWALNAITGQDPAEGTANFEEAAARWVEWGREGGLLT